VLRWFRVLLSGADLHAKRKQVGDDAAHPVLQSGLNGSEITVRPRPARPSLDELVSYALDRAGMIDHVTTRDIAVMPPEIVQEVRAATAAKVDGFKTKLSILKDLPNVDD
jgi:hypothetical protein